MFAIDNQSTLIKNTSGLRPEAHRIIVPNGGGYGTTDWINPTNGLAEGWTPINITTAVVNDNNGIRSQYISGTFPRMTQMILNFGCKYAYEIIYKSNTTVRIGVNSAFNVNYKVLPINANFTTLTGTFISPSTKDNTNITFSIIAENTGWVEVDYVNLTELPLFAYYPFNGDANDASGNGHNGTVNGATLTTDRFGESNKAYSFDGVNDNIVVPYNSAFNIATFSLFCWVNKNVNKLQGIVMRDITSGAGRFFQFLFESDGKITVINFNTTPAAFTLTSDSVIGSGWQFVGFEINNTAKTTKLFHNGNMIKQLTYTGEQQITGTQAIYIGDYNATTHVYFNGKIDDIRIYNRALSIEETKNLFFEKTQIA